MKFVNNEAAIAIAEEALRAGFQLAVQTARDSSSLHDSHVSSNFWQVAETLAWDTYEPSEAVKELTTGDTLIDTAELETLHSDLRRARRDAGDKQYMIDALIPMLGPKGREVWLNWMQAGIVRVHFDWATDPMALAGEDVAQLHLDMHEATKNAVPVESIDGDTPTTDFMADATG